MCPGALKLQVEEEEEEEEGLLLYRGFT